MRFCFLGGPGVGKGTFARLITKRLGMKHIAVGDVIRSEISKQTTLGKTMESYTSQGALIPDNLVDELVDKEMQKTDFILDGYPRTLQQAQRIDEKYPDLLAAHIVLERWVSVEKLLGRRHCAACNRSFNMADIVQGEYHMPALLPNTSTCPLGPTRCREQGKLEMRSDDTRETIEKRYDVFEKNNQPILDFFQKNNKLLTFHVKRGVDDTDDLLDAMIDKHKQYNK